MAANGPAERRERWFLRICLLPGAVWLLLLFVAPLVVLLAVSVATTNALGLPVYGFHPGNYSQVLQPLFIPVFLRTLLFAVCTTALCAVIGYPTAYVIARYGGRHRNAIVLLVILPWFVDYLIRIYSWLEIIGPNGLLGSFLHFAGLLGPGGLDLLAHNYTVIGSLVYSFLPLMILAIYVSVEQLDSSLIEAAKDLFGTPRQTFLHVTLPATAPGLIAGCLLVFLPAIGDFATASILGGPNQVMVGNVISTEIQSSGALPVGAGLTVMLVALLAVIVAVYLATARRRRRLQAAAAR